MGKRHDTYSTLVQAGRKDTAHTRDRSLTDASPPFLGPPFSFSRSEIKDRQRKAKDTKKAQAKSAPSKAAPAARKTGKK